MERTYEMFTGDGVQRDFPIGFPFMSRNYVRVSIDGEDTEFTFVAPNTARLGTAPASGSSIRVYRQTERSELIVEIPSSGNLRHSDINAQARQTLDVSAEAFDALVGTLSEDMEGHLDAGDRRIINVAEPIDVTDAVTLGWVEGTLEPVLQEMEDAVQTVEDLVDDASGSAQSAANSASNANISMINANEAKDAAEDAQAFAEDSASQASDSASDASDSAGEAANSASDALDSADAAIDAEGSAGAFADEAGDYRDEAVDAALDSIAAMEDAEDFAASASSDASDADQSASEASSSAISASESATLSEAWADNPEDEAVPGSDGRFSARHWAIKAMEAGDVGLHPDNNLSDLEDAGEARGHLGLGSMATRSQGVNNNQHRTNQQNDARFLQPGDYGLGAEGQFVDDVNWIGSEEDAVSGLFYGDGDTDERPPGHTDPAIWQISRSASQWAQIAVDTYADGGVKMSVRNRKGSTWNNWVDVLAGGGIYTGDNAHENNFPVGHIVLVQTTGHRPANNQARPIWVREATSYTTSDSAPDRHGQLSGTWRARGDLWNPANALFQRVA